MNGVTPFSYCLPRVDYLFRFDKPGNYYLYVMGTVQGKGYGNANSVYVGLDLVPLGNISFGTVPGWGVHLWHKYWPSRHIVLDIKKSGVRRVSIWGREGGTIFGKVTITGEKHLKPSNTTTGGLGEMVSAGLSETPRIQDGEPELDFSVQDPEDGKAEDDGLSVER